MDTTILSPITRSPNVVLIKKWDTKKIIKTYKNYYNYDPSRFFYGIDTISQYKCEDTGYIFFYPSIEGDSDFYSYFQQYDWYYMPWKWEHQQMRLFVKSGMSVLEIGAAEGDFLKRITSEFNNLTVTGLELNKEAVKKAQLKNLNVAHTPLGKFKKDNIEKYDIVCSFQVLEHIADVRNFICDSLNCLKKEGLLIFSVPNNDTFINESEPSLNFPPHHVGWWNEESLAKIADVFNLKLEGLVFEPIQEYHKEWYQAIILQKLFKNRIIRKGFSIIFKSYLRQFTNTLSNWAIGHSIIAVYRKI